MHIMLDIETLSTRMNAAILSIGAVRFTPTGVEGYPFYQAITLDSNIAHARHINGETVTWWMKQSDEARSASFNDPLAGHISEVLHALAVWLRGASTSRTGAAEDVYVWGNGANFDISILQSAYESADQPIPWNFRNVRCLRTIRALSGASYIARPDVGTVHHALDDAKAQALWLIDAWQADTGVMEGGQ